MIKYFVEYYLLDDPNAPKFKEVENQSIESANLPNDTCAYRFYNQNEITIGEKSFLGAKKYTPMIFLCGKRHSLEEIKESFNELSSLFSEMEENNWNRVVRVKHNNWQELEETDYDFISDIQAIPYAYIGDYSEDIITPLKNTRCLGISYAFDEVKELVKKYNRLITFMEDKVLSNAVRFSNGKWRHLEEDKIN